MIYYFKETKPFPLFYHNPYKNSKDEILGIGKDSIGIGKNLAWPYQSDIKLMWTLIAWNYKIHHHKDLLLDFRCNVAFEVDYYEMKGAKKVLKELIDDSYKIAAEQFKNDTSIYRIPFHLKDASIEHKNNLCSQILTEIVEHI